MMRRCKTWCIYRVKKVKSQYANALSMTTKSLVNVLKTKQSLLNLTETAVHKTDIS